MSEYAIRRPSEPKSISNEHLRASDKNGTPSLFEQPIDALDTLQQPVEVEPVAGATIEDVPATKSLRYPESASERKHMLKVAISSRERARIAIEAEERTTPYSELGGHRPTQESVHSPLEQVLLAYEPWMHDISMGVEYGLFDMNLADLGRMTIADRDALALYVDGYMEGLSTFKRLVATYADLEGEHDFITRKYSTHGRRTKQELLDYSSVIDTLTIGLRQNGVAGKLQQQAFNKRPSSGKRHEARKRDKLNHKGATPRVVFDQDKPRIERSL